MLYIGHEACYDALDKVLKAYEASGYTRLVMYGPGQSVLVDSKPAPGYVPGVKGKKETGVEYTPAGDGTMIDVWYLAKEKATSRQVAEASRAARSGFKAPNLLGAMVSVKRTKDGNLQLMMIAGNRDHIEGGERTDKVAIRSLSITRTPAEGGIIVALALDQSLGIPYAQLQSMAESVQGMTVAEKSTAISDKIRAAKKGTKLMSDEQANDVEKQRNPDSEELKK
jgi:hypothetical protein